MKIKFNLLRILFVVIFLIATRFTFAQGVGDHVTMSMENCTQPTPNTLEFDLIVTSDGAATSDLRASSVAFGVNYNTGILPAGDSLTVTVLANTTDKIFPVSGFTVIPTSTYSGHIRLTQAPCSNCNYGCIGRVDVSGVTVTWVSGETFVGANCVIARCGQNGSDPWTGRCMLINGVSYIVASVYDDTHLTLTSSAGTQTNVTDTSCYNFIIGQKYRVARIRMTSRYPGGTAAPWLPGPTNYSVQDVAASGRTMAVALMYEGSSCTPTAFSVTGTGDQQRSVFACSLNVNGVGITENINFMESVTIFPNPTNGKVTLSYSLQRPSGLKIELYNSYGQLVTTLVDRGQAAGRQELRFDSGKLSAGIYFIRLEADEKSTMMKMVKMD